MAGVVVVVDSGTKGWSQVHTEHFDRVALILESGVEGTDRKVDSKNGL